jgi:hypothetical protein
MRIVKHEGWPPPRPAEAPPPPQGYDGQPRFAAWLTGDCGRCGQRLAWRDQYLVVHCERCDPPRRAWRSEIPPPPAGFGALRGAGQRPGQPQKATQLTLF